MRVRSCCASVLRVFLVACAASAGNLRASSSAGFSQIYFVILSEQASPRSHAQAEQLSAHLRDGGVAPTSIRMMHAEEPPHREEYQHSHGYWTIVPYLPILHEAGKATGAVWFVFLHPTTAVSVRHLRATLAQRQHDRSWFLGHALHDVSGSIAHEYNTELAYPLDRAGYALSASLLGSLASWLKAQGEEGAGRDFHIDATWAFARFVHDRTKDGPSGAVVITDEPAFCGAGGGRGAGASASASARATPEPIDPTRCATQARRELVSSWTRKAIPPSDVVIAVKTTKLFHASRLSVLKKTWVRDVPHGMEVVYMSETEDPSVPTIDLTKEWPGLLKPNTETPTGHCAKCHALLKTLHKRWGGKQWYVVVDDDTMLSPKRLLELLSTYDNGREVAAYVGQRYAYAHTGSPSPQGADYVTMGGGAAFSGAMLSKLMACKECYCPTPNQPDDMRIGSWVDVELALPIAHEDAFHQAEMNNYHPELLGVQNIVSYHKFAGLSDAQAGRSRWLLSQSKTGAAGHEL